MSLALPFVGRRKEVARLDWLHAQRQHALILGSAGVGKTALIKNLASRLPLLICPQSGRLSDMVGALENQLGLEAGEQHLIPRKNRLLLALAGAQQIVVFDGVGWTTPRLSSFIECVMERAAVWIATRSEHSWDIGHVWPLLGHFERVKLNPFHPAETRELVAAASVAGLIPREALNIVAWMHRRSNGCPLVLRELLKELATGRYDLTNPHALKLLDLDRRIHELLPVTSFYK